MAFVVGGVVRGGGATAVCRTRAILNFKSWAHAFLSMRVRAQEKKCEGKMGLQSRRTLGAILGILGILGIRRDILIPSLGVVYSGSNGNPSSLRNQLLSLHFASRGRWSPGPPLLVRGWCSARCNATVLSVQQHRRSRGTSMGTNCSPCSASQSGYSPSNPMAPVSLAGARLPVRGCTVAFHLVSHARRDDDSGRAHKHPLVFTVLEGDPHPHARGGSGVEERGPSRWGTTSPPMTGFQSTAVDSARSAC